VPVSPGTTRGCRIQRPERLSLQPRSNFICNNEETFRSLPGSSHIATCRTLLLGKRSDFVSYCSLLGVEQCSPTVNVRHLQTSIVLAQGLAAQRLKIPNRLSLANKRPCSTSRMDTILALLTTHSRRNLPMPVIRSGRRQHYLQMYMETTKPTEWSVHSDEYARNHCRCPAKTRCEPS
jgi:hypothetical protein